MRSYPCIYCGPFTKYDHEKVEEDNEDEAYKILDNLKAAVANKCACSGPSALTSNPPVHEKEHQEKTQSEEHAAPGKHPQRAWAAAALLQLLLLDQGALAWGTHMLWIQHQTLHQNVQNDL